MLTITKDEKKLDPRRLSHRLKPEDMRLNMRNFDGTSIASGHNSSSNAHSPTSSRPQSPAAQPNEDKTVDLNRTDHSKEKGSRKLKTVLKPFFISKFLVQKLVKNCEQCKADQAAGKRVDMCYHKPMRASVRLNQSPLIELGKTGKSSKKSKRTTLKVKPNTPPEEEEKDFDSSHSLSDVDVKGSVYS